MLNILMSCVKESIIDHGKEKILFDKKTKFDWIDKEMRQLSYLCVVESCVTVRRYGQSLKIFYF